MATTVFYHFPSYPYENASEDLKRRVWEKAGVIDNVDPDLIRSDPFGLSICYSEHGNRNSDMGWEMVYITGQGVEQQDAETMGKSRPVDADDTEAEDAGKLFPVHWRMNHRERQN
jgi:hypothetical protein